MTDTSNVIQLPSATEPTEAMKTQYLNLLKERATALMQDVINENPTHVLVITINPDLDKVGMDAIGITSTLPLRNPQDVQNIVEILHEVLKAVTNANGMSSDTDGDSKED